MSFAHVTCPACNGPLEVEAMHADGASHACRCGRTRLTSLLDGKLEQLEVPPADLGLVTDDQLDDYEHLRRPEGEW